jgi:hypothetical protein
MASRWGIDGPRAAADPWKEMRSYRIRTRVVVYFSLFSLVWFVPLFVQVIRWMPRTWDAGAIAGELFLLFHTVLPLIAMGLLPYEATIATDGTCEFRAFFRVRRVRAQQMTYVETDEGAIFIHHQRGKVQLCELCYFDEFLAQLLQFNPAIKLPAWAQQDVAGYKSRRS